MPPKLQQQEQQGVPRRIRVTQSKRKPWTHTNTDKDCLREDSGMTHRFIYTIDTHNGVMLFNKFERAACHLVAGVGFAAFGLSSYFFLRGFIDGVTMVPVSS